MASWARTLKWVKNFCMTDKTTVDEVKNRILDELETHAEELRVLDAERVAAGLAPWHRAEIERLSSLIGHVRYRLVLAESQSEPQPTQDCVLI